MVEVGRHVAAVMDDAVVAAVAVQDDEVFATVVGVRIDRSCPEGHIFLVACLFSLG